MPRLIAANADLNNVFINGPATGSAGERLFDLDQDLSRLKAQLDALGDVALIIIDPVTAFLGKKDANKIGDVRGILAKLAHLAESYRTCVLAISHLNKDEAKKAVYRTIGSVGFSAAARTVFMVVKDASDPNRRIMAPVKSNIGPDTDGYAWRVQSVVLPQQGIKTSKVVFEDTVYRSTADELLGVRSEGGAALKEAMDFLKAMLGNGAIHSAKLKEDAQAAGINESTLIRARRALGVIPQKVGDKWYSRLPESLPIKSAPDGAAVKANGAAHPDEVVEPSEEELQRLVEDNLFGTPF